MRTKHLIFGIILLMLTFSACRDITVTTTVNSDGSFTRIVTVTGDSTDVLKTDLPYPVDTSWVMQMGKDTADSSKFIVTYTKLYKNSDELDSEIRSDTGWMRQLNRHLEIRKKFGFFYSYVLYSEVYSAANPFTALPYKEYLTPEEYSWATRGSEVQNPSDSTKRKDAEEKVLLYLMESATAEVEKILSDGITKLHDSRLDAKQVERFHDSITALLTKRDFNNPGNFIDYYSMWTGNPAVLKLHDLQPPIFEGFDKKAKLLEQILLMEEFRVEADLPGLITATNSTVLKGNRVSWAVFPMAFLFEDYTMTAESRIINVWAFVLSGLVLFALLSLLVFKSMKR